MPWKHAAVTVVLVIGGSWLSLLLYAQIPPLEQVESGDGDLAVSTIANFAGGAIWHIVPWALLMVPALASILAIIWRKHVFFETLGTTEKLSKPAWAAIGAFAAQVVLVPILVTINMML